MTSQCRCDALTNRAMKPLTLGAGHLWVLMSITRYSQVLSSQALKCGEESGHHIRRSPTLDVSMDTVISGRLPTGNLLIFHKTRPTAGNTKVQVM